jgi:hypothetical protein
MAGNHQLQRPPTRHSQPGFRVEHADFLKAPVLCRPSRRRAMSNKNIQIWLPDMPIGFQLLIQTIMT